MAGVAVARDRTGEQIYFALRRGYATPGVGSVLDQFSATIEKIYKAASGGSRWEDALIAVENLTGSAGAVIDLIPKSDALVRKTLAGSFTEENCAEYAGTYQAICPRIRYAVEHPGADTQYDYLFMTERSMDRDPVYDWFGKHGLRYYVGCSVTSTPNYLAYASLQRTRRQGHASPKDVELFNLLKPHLTHAVSLADQLGTLRSYQQFSSAVFEALPQAVFALDGNGLVLFANAAAEEVIGSCDGLRVEAGCLRCALPSEQAPLETRIRGAIVPLGGCSSAWTRVSRVSGRLPYAVFVAPLHVADEDLLATEAKVLLVVHDPCARRNPDLHMLTAIYGLTETEARLASAISAGHSLESAAASLHMQIATARSHLKSVFAKLGVNRQQDLVRLLTSLSSISF